MPTMRLLAICIAFTAVLMPAVANNCSISPLVLAIANNTLSGDGIALNRGIGCSIGGEVEGLRIDFTRNNTGIRNSLDCATAGNLANVSLCIGASGGVFSVSNSTTFRAATNDAWNVTSIDPSPNGAHIIRGYDVGIFASNVTIPGIPLEVWSDTTSLNRSSIGLGTASSLLTAFLDADVIPSPEIGLFYGSRSVAHPSDGELVIGGYNKARVDGSFHNFSLSSSYLDQPCPLQVLLKDVVISRSDGTRNSIMVDPGTLVPACVNPVENAFQFTPAMYKLWANITQVPSNPPADGSPNYTTQVYPLANEPLMNELTITLQGGYEVTIPHYELITLQRGDNAQGLYDVINSSRIQSAVTSNGGRFDFPILGGVFASQNYIRVDYAQNVFSLAKAVTGDISPADNTIISTCVANNSQPVEPPSLPPPAPKSGLSKGAIAGIVVGSVIGFVLLALLAFLFFRARRRSNAAARQGPPVPLASRPDMTVGPGGLPRRWSELEDNGKSDASELPSNNRDSVAGMPTVVEQPASKQSEGEGEAGAAGEVRHIIEGPIVYR